MKLFNLICVFILFANQAVISQTLTQYFDGFDPTNYSIVSKKDSTRPNAWQVGKPRKTHFNAAASNPNAMVTDTLHAYPINDTNQFTLNLTVAPLLRGIDAIQWKQKIDLDSGKDGAIIEYSTDSGKTWHNVFNDPNVYNFYGFDSANVDTLPGGEYALSGTDTSWRDVWLCFDAAWTGFASINGSFQVRFTLLSDSIQQNREGWMIDNMQVHTTSLHASVNKIQGNDLFQIYPNPANHILHIESAKLSGSEIIDKMEVLNYTGKSVSYWTNIPAKYFVDVSNYANGMYYLKINTKQGVKCYPIVVLHK